MNLKYIPARKSQLNYYRDVPLYSLNKEGEYVLYKSPGLHLTEMRIEQERHPEVLYIEKKDKLAGIREVQTAFNRQLEDHITQNAPKKVKDTIVTIVEETYHEPRTGSIEGLSETVDILVSDIAYESNILRNLLFVSNNDYTSVLHSINVMALVIGYATHENYTLEEKKVLGLSGLLHDVGKAKIDSEILTAPRKLTSDEFDTMKTHTTIGYRILNSCKFSRPEIKLSALQQHEKKDGTGYPTNRSDISKTAQIVGVIDCYEALTNDDRPYRNAMEPFKALSIIKEDVAAGKYNKSVFEKFCRSLL
jgi:HD-GYP domain-containing protein (c-di-GMP phosphodiesterase class II)